MTREQPATARDAALNEPRVVAHLLRDDGEIPNNPRLPLLVYKNAVTLGAGDPAAVFERLFTANGWAGSWRNGVFPFHHFHSTAHEVLGVYAGSASIRLGGESGVTLEVAPGDVVIIPAGVGHKKLASRGDFGVVGAYPAGQHPDICRGGRREFDERAGEVARVALPAMDPVYGEQGPLLEHWRPA